VVSTNAGRRYHGDQEDQHEMSHGTLSCEELTINHTLVSCVSYVKKITTHGACRAPSGRILLPINRERCFERYRTYFCDPRAMDAGSD
jgi:hypothetical protein